MPIPIAQAELNAKQQIIGTLEMYLPGELTSAATSDYPLPAPERYIEAPVANPMQAFRKLNIDEVGCWVTNPADTSVFENGEFTGDGTQYERVQDLQFQVSILARTRPGFDYPTVRGRQMLEEEWLWRRGEKYKGAVVDALTQHANDGQYVLEVSPDGFSDELGVSEADNFGKFLSAAVTIGLVQEVLIKT